MKLVRPVGLSDEGQEGSVGGIYSTAVIRHSTGIDIERSEDLSGGPVEMEDDLDVPLRVLSDDSNSIGGPDTRDFTGATAFDALIDLCDLRGCLIPVLQSIKKRSMSEAAKAGVWKWRKMPSPPVTLWGRGWRQAETDPPQARTFALHRSAGQKF